METILSEQSLDWFDKSKREMKLFNSFFVAREKMERKIQSQLKAFAIKWRSKFEDTLEEASTPPTLADRARSDIITLLVDKPMDNANFYEGKRPSPSAIVKRWLADPINNTTCLAVDHFKSTFYNTTEDLADCAETVKRAKRVAEQIFEAYHIAKVDESNIKEVKAKRDRDEQLRIAKKAYQQAVKNHKKMEKTFMKEMTNLRNCLDSYENNRLSVLKNALDVHQTALNECEKERESRKQQIEGFFNGFSVQETVKQWLDSMKEPFHCSVYPNDPVPKDEDVEYFIPVIQTADGLKVKDVVLEDLVSESETGVKTSNINKEDNGQKIQHKAANDDGLGYGSVPVKKESKKRRFKKFFEKR